MGINQTMTWFKKILVNRKAEKSWVLNKYGFEISNEVKDYLNNITMDLNLVKTKDLRQKKDGGKQTMDLDLQKK